MLVILVRMIQVLLRPILAPRLSPHNDRPTYPYLHIVLPIRDEALPLACQLRPPSWVVNCRPSSAKTVAESSSLAATFTRSASVGDAIDCHCSPSVVRKIVPPRPTTQQISADGAVPAKRSLVVPLFKGRQLAPSLERAMTPPGVNLQKVRFPTDATVTGLVRTALPEALDWTCGGEATGLEGWSASEKRAAMELEGAATGEDLVVAGIAGADSGGLVPGNWYVADTEAAGGCFGEVLVGAAGTTLVTSSPGLGRLLFAGGTDDCGRLFGASRADAFEAAGAWCGATSGGSSADLR